MGILGAQRRDTQITGRDSQKWCLSWISKKVTEIIQQRRQRHSRSHWQYRQRYSGIGSGGPMFGECMWISSHKPSKDIGGTQAYKATDLVFSWPVPVSCYFTHCKYQNSHGNKACIFYISCSLTNGFIWSCWNVPHHPFLPIPDRVLSLTPFPVWGNHCYRKPSIESLYGIMCYNHSMVFPSNLKIDGINRLWLLFIALQQNSSKICMLIPKRLTRQMQHRKGAGKCCPTLRKPTPFV